MTKKIIVGLSLLFLSSPLLADSYTYKCPSVYFGKVVAQSGHYRDIETAKEAALVKCRNWARDNGKQPDSCMVKACGKYKPKN